MWGDIFPPEGFAGFPVFGAVEHFEFISSDAPCVHIQGGEWDLFLDCVGEGEEHFLGEFFGALCVGGVNAFKELEEELIFVFRVVGLHVIHISYHGNTIS